jgi:hypothetical protein
VNPNTTTSQAKEPRLVLTSDNQPPADGTALVPFQFKGELLLDGKRKNITGTFNVPVEEAKCTRRALDLVWVFLTEACGYKITFLSAAPASSVGQLAGKDAP